MLALTMMNRAQSWGNFEIHEVFMLLRAQTHDLSMVDSQCPDLYMMTSSNGNIFRVTAPLWGNSPGTSEFPSQRPVTQSFDVFFLSVPKQKVGQTNHWDAADLRCHCAHYDVTVMIRLFIAQGLTYPFVWRSGKVRWSVGQVDFF